MDYTGGERGVGANVSRLNPAGPSSSNFWIQAATDRLYITCLYSRTHLLRTQLESMIFHVCMSTERGQVISLHVCLC